MKKLVLSALVLACCSLSWGVTPGSSSVNEQKEAAALLAQKNAAEAAPHSVFSTADCAFTFTSGSGNSFLKYCVTANGNVTVFQTPEGHEHIAVGTIGEGYGICDESTEQSYYDYTEAGDTSNWDAPTVQSQNAKSVTIARNTSDGIWTLTQTFTQVTKPSPGVKISMTLKNNSAVDREAILVRYVDVDADGFVNNNLDTTTDNTFGWNSAATTGHAFGPRGVMLQNLSAPTNRLEFASTFAKPFSFAPDPCVPELGEATEPLIDTDGSLVGYHEMPIARFRTKTITFAYTRF